MISFSRTALSVLQLTSYHFGAHTGSDHPEVHSAGPKTQLDFAPEKLIDYSALKHVKHVVQRSLQRVNFCWME